MVAEPLAAPFAHPGSGQWNTNLPNAVLRGNTNLSVNFRAWPGTTPCNKWICSWMASISARWPTWPHVPEIS